MLTHMHKLKEGCQYRKFFCLTLSQYLLLFSEFRLRYPGNRWKQMIAEGNKVVAMVITWQQMVGGPFLFYFILYLYKYIMVLTREEKERLVLDLSQPPYTHSRYSKRSRMSFRDIGRIIDREEKEKEAREG